MNNFSIGTPVNAATTGIATFAKCPICTDIRTIEADIGILGAPFDIAIQGRSGTRLGPRGIRIGSTRFSYKPGGTYDPERKMMYLDTNRWTIQDCGDVDYVPGDLEATNANLTEAVKILVARKVFPVILGGDHSITYPDLCGMGQAGPFDIIHIDAHLDWTQSVGGQRHSNGSPMRCAADLDYVGNILHLGIRGIGSSGPSDFADAAAHGDEIYSVKQVRKEGIDAVLSPLQPKRKVYVTFDIDAMDATCAPGTGSPMFGGFWYEEMVELLEAIAKRFHVIGMDLVEVAPQYDEVGSNSNTCYLAARLISDLLGFVTKELEMSGQD